MPNGPLESEHASLELILLMHPNEGGIFSHPREERYQIHELMIALSQKFGYQSLHLLRNELSEIQITQTGNYFIPEVLQKKADSVEKMWVESHGLEYSKDEVEKGFVTAESVIDYFTQGIFSDVTQIQPINEVASARKFLILLHHALNHPDPHVRFESARKLYVTNLALGAEKIRKESQPRIDLFYNLLDQHMFTNPKTESPEPATTLENAHFISYHVGDDFRCGFVRELQSNEKIDESMIGLNMRIHTVPMRTWYDNDGHAHKVLFEPRVKDAPNFIIKELRNSTMNELTLDDNLGAKLTFTSLQEAELFFSTLQSKIPISPLISDVHYSIHENSRSRDRHYSGRHAASSKNFETIKYHTRIYGTSYEFQINTVRTWIDQKLRDDVCWEDYMVKRIVTPDRKGQTPVTQLLFPKQIYGIDLTDAADLILKAGREYRRHLPTIIPPEVRRKDRLIRMMSSSELRSSVESLAAQILETVTTTTHSNPESKIIYSASPKDNLISNMFIVIAESDPARLESSAQLLSRKLGLPRNHVLSTAEIKKIPKTAKIIIFDDIFVRGRQLLQVYKNLMDDYKFPEKSLFVATIVADKRATKMFKTDRFFFSQQTNSRTTRIVFPFENEKRMYSRSCVFISIRKNESSNASEILMEVLPDGRLKIPGGAKNNGESPKRTVAREIFEELERYIPLRAIKGVFPKAIMTSFEPHNKLTKPYTEFMLHEVFQISSSLFSGDLPKGFQWIDMKKVLQYLRWSGQKELWLHLIEENIIHLNDN